MKEISLKKKTIKNSKNNQNRAVAYYKKKLRALEEKYRDIREGLVAET